MFLNRKKKKKISKKKLNILFNINYYDKLNYDLSKKYTTNFLIGFFFTDIIKLLSTWVFSTILSSFFFFYLFNFYTFYHFSMFDVFTYRFFYTQIANTVSLNYDIINNFPETKNLYYISNLNVIWDGLNRNDIYLNSYYVWKDNLLINFFYKIKFFNFLKNGLYFDSFLKKTTLSILKNFNINFFFVFEKLHFNNIFFISIIFNLKKYYFILSRKNFFLFTCIFFTNLFFINLIYVVN